MTLDRNIAAPNYGCLPDETPTPFPMNILYNAYFGFLNESVDRPLSLDVGCAYQGLSLEVNWSYAPELIIRDVDIFEILQIRC